MYEHTVSKQWRRPEIETKGMGKRSAWYISIYNSYLYIQYFCINCYKHSANVGDFFHFMWECLRVIFRIFWGKPSQPGSLCNLCERVQVDKAVKVFSIGDEFMMHAFRAHLTAGILTTLNLNSTSDPIQHPESHEWLKHKAQALLFNPQKSEDPVHQLHLSFLHHAFLYIDLHEAVRWKNGPEIARHWKWWLPRFLGTGRKNYAAEAVYHICNINISADFPKHIAYLATHNRTVNVSGKPGQGKPVDQLIEHYNL